MSKKQFTDSKTIREIEYFPENKTLHITYTTGKKYQYVGIPSELWDAMQVVESIGSFVAQKIKGHYQYKQI